MTKVLMLTGDGGESLEVMYPYQRLQEEGYEVDIAAPSKKMIQTVVHDFVPGFDTYTEKLGYLVKADLAFSEVNPEEYSCASFYVLYNGIFAGGACKGIQNSQSYYQGDK